MYLCLMYMSRVLRLCRFDMQYKLEAMSLLTVYPDHRICKLFEQSKRYFLTKTEYMKSNMRVLNSLKSKLMTLAMNTYIRP